MKPNKVGRGVQLIVMLCGFALCAILFIPIWKIDLFAPQYPEGLKLLIYPNHLSGNVDIINGLNHYIGMKALHTSDFLEFTILPYIIIVFCVLLLATAIIGSRKLLVFSTVLFIFFGVLSMVDFWRWEYNYGHELNPEAAIKVPGMAYQPPMLGYKQLLNFGAYSMPDIGGWLFVAVGIILLSIIIIESIAERKARHLSLTVGSVSIVVLLLSISACHAGPMAILVGKDQCNFCKMTVSDNRFGAEIITKKGKVYKFDDAHCILSYLQASDFDRTDVKDVFFTDYSGIHSLINVNGAFFLKSEKLRSPMEGNIAAFENIDSLNKVKVVYEGKILKWGDIYKNE